MSIQQSSTERNVGTVSAGHPLDPLTGDEIEGAVAILRAERDLGPKVRFEVVTLHEPPKEAVLNFSPGDASQREAFIVLLENTTGNTYESIVSLTDGAVVSWKHIPEVQPSFMIDEMIEVPDVVKAHPDYLEALAKRGITDTDLLMIDTWGAGNFGVEEEKGVRLGLARSWLRSSPTDNGYARPIEGVTAWVDLNKMEVIRVVDQGVVPLPPNPSNYAAEFVKEFRKDLKPVEITQPEGLSFEVDGNHVRWQKWHLRVGFNHREGLVLYNVGYEDGGRVRPIMYRASLSEMVVPYGDPSDNHFRKAAFDVGEAGIGVFANSLELGCDCLGEIRYFDATISDNKGGARTIRNAICVHEEDFGILWKHTDMATGQAEVRRSRRLVVSSISTLGNYDYGFFWYFYLDGTIEYQIKSTGIVNTVAIPAGEAPKFGTLIAPQLQAQNHQHIFNVRLDMNVDGGPNSVYEVNTVSEPMGPTNPYGNAFFADRTLLETESESQREINPFTGRYWVIVNPSATNYIGQNVGYKLMPGENVGTFAHPDSPLVKRAGYMTKHLWVTPYHPDEKYAAGDYPNQHPGGAGLPEWTRANRRVDNTDTVVWYTFGAHHLPCPEDWPVMPVVYTGFTLKPQGFFDRNPGLDVPPSHQSNGACHH